MKILDLIYQQAKKKGLEFILIGGHAINAMGDRRQTRDIDLVICESDSNQWKELLLALGYEELNFSDAFLQFNPTDVAQWPVDIILVNKETYNGLRDQAKAMNIGGQYDVLIPAVEHLIAMKLHTLKQGNQERKLRDLLDVITLVRHNQMDVHSDNFKQLCEIYATPEIYEEIINTFSGHK
jgi:predicted nucleotidyltransferase